MTASIRVEQFKGALFQMLDEAFENVTGMFLDKGTSLFETLEEVSAEEASRPVSATCASIAAQVEHTRFYLEVMTRYARGEQVGEIDWDASWQLASVTDDEWAALKANLRETYTDLRTILADDTTWQHEDAVGGAMAVLAHTAYHLGEIRQAMCTVVSRG